MSVINTNYLALVSQNNLTKSQNSLGTAIERLSSGLRINSAKDDAAGQAIANRMTSQIRGLTQAARNANDGISLAQTAEGALTEVNNNLQRIRELTVQAKNSTNSPEDIASIKAEVDERLAEIGKISSETSFNGTTILAAADTHTFQVGFKDGETRDVEITDPADWNLGTFDVETGTLADLDTAIEAVDTQRSLLGAAQNRFESVISNLNNTVTNLSAARSRIEDADYAVEVSNMTRAQILQQAGTSVLAQANQVPQTVLSLLR